MPRAAAGLLRLRRGTRPSRSSRVYARRLGPGGRGPSDEFRVRARGHGVEAETVLGPVLRFRIVGQAGRWRGSRQMLVAGFPLRGAGAGDRRLPEGRSAGSLFRVLPYGTLAPYYYCQCDS